MAPSGRLNTTIDPVVDQRLRTLAAITRKPLGELLSELLDKALPQAADLAGRMAAALGVAPAGTPKDQATAVPALAEAAQAAQSAGR